MTVFDNCSYTFVELQDSAEREPVLTSTLTYCNFSGLRPQCYCEQNTHKYLKDDILCPICYFNQSMYKSHKIDKIYLLDQ